MKREPLAASSAEVAMALERVKSGWLFAVRRAVTPVAVRQELECRASEVERITIHAQRALIHVDTKEGPLLVLVEGRTSVLLMGQWLLDTPQVVECLERGHDAWPAESLLVCSVPRAEVYDLALAGHDLALERVQGSLSFYPGEIHITSMSPEELGLARAQ